MNRESLLAIDPTSFGFLVVVAVMGGGIAILADNLGRRIGKRRHTLGRLRPRHTATLFTFTAGFLIPILVVLAVMGVSESVRRWIIEGNQVNESLRKERNELNQQIAAKATELERASEQYRIAQESLVSARSEVARLSNSEEALKASVQNLQADAKKLQGNLASLQRQLKENESSLGETQDRLKKLNSEYARVYEDYTDIQNRNIELTSSNAQLEKDLAASGERLRVLDAEMTSLTEETKRLEAQRSQLESINTQLTSQLRIVDDALEEAQQKLADEQRNLDAARREAAFIQAQLSANIDASRRKPMVFRINEELARISVDPSQSAPEARNIVTSLLRTARVTAEGRGALPSDVEALPSAGLWPVALPDGRIVTASDQEAEIARAVTAVGEPLVIIAAARWNVFQGEPVPLEVNIYRNRLVFRAGQIISETRIDGRQSEDEIVRSIDRFLSGAVKNRAIEGGMIPFFGNDAEVGSVTSEEILALVRTIKEANRELRLVAYTDVDVRAADRLRLKFRMN